MDMDVDTGGGVPGHYESNCVDDDDEVSRHGQLSSNRGRGSSRPITSLAFSFGGRRRRRQSDLLREEFFLTTVMESNLRNRVTQASRRNWRRLLVQYHHPARRVRRLLGLYNTAEEEERVYDQVASMLLTGLQLDGRRSSGTGASVGELEINASVAAGGVGESGINALVAGAGSGESEINASVSSSS